jgi:hypothetical protein
MGSTYNPNQAFFYLLVLMALDSEPFIILGDLIFDILLDPDAFYYFFSAT